jgi:hypothetical protein
MPRIVLGLATPAPWRAVCHVFSICNFEWAAHLATSPLDDALGRYVLMMP